VECTLGGHKAERCTDEHAFCELQSAASFNILCAHLMLSQTSCNYTSSWHCQQLALTHQ